MIALTASFFLVEIITGYVTNSLALVGDSYHMLSDVVALLVGFASVRISKWSSDKNTYGWARAEVLGALVNSVFLIALCFTIFVEALQRIVHDDHIHNPKLMLIVGVLGLVINLIGLVLFGSHGHSHGGGHGHSHGGGGHGHSHGDHGHSHGSNAEKAKLSPQHEASAEKEGESSEDESDPVEAEKKAIIKSSAQLNMRAVFLHVMGDALGSVVVIISALVIMYVEQDWKYKVDPAMSMVMVCIILSTTIPLLRESAMILLQTVPTNIKVDDLTTKLVEKVEGVLAVHEFHIWQLAGNRIIASAHIRCQTLNDYMRIAEAVKTFFHNEGIHSTTIQPEFVEYEEIKAGRDCVLECGPDKDCFTDTCCGKKGSKRSPGGGDGVRQRTHNTTSSNPELSSSFQPDNVEAHI